MCTVPVACYERLMWFETDETAVIEYQTAVAAKKYFILYTPSYFLKPALKSTLKALSDLAQLCVGTEGNGHANWKSPQRPLQILPGLRAVSSFCRISCSMCEYFYRHYCKTKSSEIANMCYSSTFILWAPDFSLTGWKPKKLQRSYHWSLLRRSTQRPNGFGSRENLHDADDFLVEFPVNQFSYRSTASLMRKVPTHQQADLFGDLSRFFMIYHDLSVHIYIYIIYSKLEHPAAKSTPSAPSPLRFQTLLSAAWPLSLQGTLAPQSGHPAVTITSLR